MHPMMLSDIMSKNKKGGFAMKHFLIFSLKSVCYGSYLYFADALGKALEKAGHSIEVFSSKKEPLEALERLSGKSFDAALDFNSELPRLKMDDGSYFLDQVDAPFYDVLLDHPLYHHDSLKQGLSNYHALCLDKNHMDYIKAHYPHIRSVHLFAMTGEDISPQDASYPKKEIDVLFSGTYTDYRKVEHSLKDTPGHLLSLTKQLIDRMQSDGSLTQEAALKSLLPSLEEAEVIEETFPLHMQACFLCDTYLRAYKREKLLMRLAKDGVPLTLLGNGFRKSPLSDFPKLRIIEDASFFDTFSFFRASKICLNLLPEFKNGTHDRIYSAMLSHSLCLTDASPLLREEFTDQTELCFYDWRDPRGLAQLTAELLSSPSRLRQISQNGYAAAKKSHSWQARAASLLRIIP